jgi:isopentenyl-diphosphate delta-isomerase
MVILVNEQNEWLGMMDKVEAHKEGLLHRAISVFIINGKKELLIQQRADSKYHSGGLWSNACCSHPMQGESSAAAAHRRLREELGFDCELQAAFILRYDAVMDNGLVENEYDHVYFGTYSGTLQPDPAEVKAYRYIGISDLEQEIKANPAAFTAWLHLALPKFIQYLTTSGWESNPGTQNNLYQ